MLRLEQHRAEPAVDAAAQQHGAQQRHALRRAAGGAHDVRHRTPAAAWLTGKHEAVEAGRELREMLQKKNSFDDNALKKREYHCIEGGQGERHASRA